MALAAGGAPVVGGFPFGVVGPRMSAPVDLPSALEPGPDRRLRHGEVRGRVEGLDARVPDELGRVAPEK